MTATVSFCSVAEHAKFPDFCASTDRWSLEDPTGKKIDVSDWVCRSRFGSVGGAVVIGSDGSPNFDRPIYREAPNVNVIAWGLNEHDEVMIGILDQPRPHADDPEQPGDGHPPVVFGNIPMGFLETIVGKDGPRLEDVRTGAARETGEETGATAIIAITRPDYPHMNPNPTFVATWSELCFVQVDLAKVERLKLDRSEPIYKAAYITVAELMRRIRDGKENPNDRRSPVYRMGISLADLLVFFACHPKYLKSWVLAMCP